MASRPFCCRGGGDERKSLLLCLSLFNPSCRNAGSGPWVLGWAILLLLGGGAVASTPKRDGPVFGLLAAVVAGGILYLFYLKTNQEVQSVLAQSMGLIQFNWAIGFWMAMGATILVGIGALIRLGENR